MAAAVASACARSSSSSLVRLAFSNRSVSGALPLDPEPRNFVRRSVANAVFSLVEPTPVANPRLVALAPSALALLGVDEPSWTSAPDEFAALFSGSKALDGARPAAHCYCGHQFGYFSGQLGDGATMYCGEVLNAAGERWELQFKGAGKTPYSRDGDGRKVLRSSIREFLCSEAMHALGVPTTRAGTVVTSDTMVVRDIHYNGNPIEERATVITRIAPTFLRFGSFEICWPLDPTTRRAGPSADSPAVLARLVDYTIEHIYPEIWAAHTAPAAPPTARVGAFFAEVVRRTAVLAARWQAVGFCHGVLNTDNTSIVGVTVDYGPFGWMEHFDPNYVCNGSDTEGRYSYANQPEMLKFNCGKLGEALGTLLDEADRSAAVQSFDDVYGAAYASALRAKLGLHSENPHDAQLVDSLFTVMAETGADFTDTFRSLGELELESGAGASWTAGSRARVLDTLLARCERVAARAKRFRASGAEKQLAKIELILERNPAALAHIPEPVLTAELERMRAQRRLAAVPEDDKAATDRRVWSGWLDRYAARTRADEVAALPASERRARMHAVNPRIVLRNWMAQRAIDDATRGDFTTVQRLHAALESPYAPVITPGEAHDDAHAALLAEPVCGLGTRPDGADMLIVT